MYNSILYIFLPLVIIILFYDTFVRYGDQFKLPSVQEVVTPFYIVSYYIKRVTTSWTYSNIKASIRYKLLRCKKLEKVTYIYDSFAASTIIKLSLSCRKISRIWLVRRVKMSFSRGNSETFYQLEKFEHMSSPGLEEINYTEENCQKKYHKRRFLYQ